MELLSAYTADQWGLVTTAQARKVGVDSVTLLRLGEAGFLEHVRRGVHAATAAGESAHEAERAAWLLLNPAVPAWERPKLDVDGGVISHRSAALLHGIGDLVAERVEITVPRRRTTRDPDTRLRVGRLPDDDVTLVDGLPVTTVERTVLDLIADHVDGGHAGQVIHQAARRGLLDLDRLAPRLGDYCRRYGVRGRDGHALIDNLLEQAGIDPARARPQPTPPTSPLSSWLSVRAAAGSSLPGALGIFDRNGALARIMESSSGISAIAASNPLLAGGLGSAAFDVLKSNGAFGAGLIPSSALGVLGGTGIHALRSSAFDAARSSLWSDGSLGRAAWAASGHLPVNPAGDDGDEGKDGDPSVEIHTDSDEDTAR